MSEIDFEAGEPIWAATVSHNQPNTPGVWGCVVNASSEEEAIRLTIKKFEFEGMNPARITRIVVEELKLLSDGG